MEDEKTIRLVARSSKDERTFYNIDFVFSGNRMAIRCSCPAGRFGKFCKHKTEFLQGKDFHLAHEEDAENLAYVASWAQKSDYLDLIVKASKARRAMEEAEALVAKVNQEIGEAMKNGLPSWGKQ